MATTDWIRQELDQLKAQGLYNTIRVIDSPQINHIAVPGGYVYVTRGLLDLVRAREPHQDWQLTDTVNDLERYLTARTYWRDSYRKAARFYRPPEAEKAFGGPVSVAHEGATYTV